MNLAHEKRLRDLLDEIEKLERLAKEFDGYTSSPEEENFIETLIAELGGMRKKLNRITDSCKQVKAMCDKAKGLYIKKSA